MNLSEVYQFSLAINAIRFNCTRLKQLCSKPFQSHDQSLHKYSYILQMEAIGITKFETLKLIDVKLSMEWFLSIIKKGNNLSKLKTLVFESVYVRQSKNRKLQQTVFPKFVTMIKTLKNLKMLQITHCVIFHLLIMMFILLHFHFIILLFLYYAQQWKQQKQQIFKLLSMY